MGNGENVSEWERVARDVQETIGELEGVHRRCGAVLENADTSGDARDSQFLPEETVQFASKIKEKVTEFAQMEKLLNYLQWLKKTKTLRLARIGECFLDCVWKVHR